MKKNMVLIFSYIFLFLIFVFDFWKYYPLYLFGSDQIFTDWNYIFNYYNCLNKIDLSYKNCKEILNFKFVYPSIWFDIVNYIYSYFNYLIIFFIIFYVFLSYLILKKNNKIYYLLFLFSPVSILLIQRGNNEILIFILVYLFSYFFYFKKYNLLSLVSISIATILKIYPIGLFLLLFFDNIKKINYIKIISFIILTIIIYYFLDEFLEINKHHNPGKITLVYGSETIFHIFNLLFDDIKINTFLLSISSLIVIIIVSLCTSNKKYNYLNKNNEISFLIGSILIVSSFFFNSSFEYRFIYILFSLPYLIDLSNSKQIKFGKYLIILIYLVLWSELFIFYAKEFTNFNYIRSEYGNILNINTIFVGLLVLIKNIIFWIINFMLIIISKNIIFTKLR